MLIPKFLKIESNNKWIRGIVVQLRHVRFKVQSVYMELKSYGLMISIKNSDYLKLKHMKNSYKGNRCFIIATGPSLTLEDLNKLKSEYTFGMNSLCLIYNKIDWKTTFFGVQDLFVYDKISDTLKISEQDNIFIGSNIAKERSIPKKWIKYPLNIVYHIYELYLRKTPKYFVKFSDDSHRMVYDGYSITYSLIQIAAYLGFNEIYLIGADCNYEVGKPQHFIEHGHFDPTFASAKERMTIGYIKAKEYADKNEIKICNVTRGGKLEVFPRVNLDDVLKGEKNG